MPCENCKRTGRLCIISIKQVALLPVFVTEQSRNESNSARCISLVDQQIIDVLPQPMRLKDDDCALQYFFVSFLPMNILVSDGTVDTALLAMVKTSPALRDAVQAIATLQRRRHDQSIVDSPTTDCQNYQALKAYNRSVCSMQSLITSNNFLGDPSALWTTFLLGLFEVRGKQREDSCLDTDIFSSCETPRVQTGFLISCMEHARYSVFSIPEL
jgi:hypothetical protein